MRMSTSLSPLPRKQFDRAAARHLLSRAGFGGTPQQIRDLQAMGLDKAVDHLIDFSQTDVSGLPALDIDRDVMRKRTPEEGKEYRAARDAQDQEVLDRFNRMGQAARAKDRKLFAQLQQWWGQRMIETPRPAEERLTLLWHGHFASSYRAVPDAYLMQQQNDLLRREANGSFAQMVKGIVRDPTMLRYLNNNRNNKRRPNENLARELMELFTLGVGHYSEKDIKEGARSLTGYSVDDNDFRFNKGQHDDEPKSILGQTGNFDGDQFADLLLKHEACAKFTCLKLYDHFVADVGDRYEAVLRTASRSHRCGWRSDSCGRITKSNRCSPSCFAASISTTPPSSAGRSKTPPRCSPGPSGPWALRHGNTVRSSSGMQAMGQVLFQPPTVNGWDSGRAWINTSTLFARQNLATYLISGKHPDKKFKAGSVDYRPSQLLTADELTSPENAVDAVLPHLLGDRVSPERRAVALKFIQDRGGNLADDSLVALLCLVTSMPEYQLC